MTAKPDMLHQFHDARWLREHLGHLNHNELLVAQATARAILEHLPAMGFALVPTVPPPGLLMSMALRSDHALGCPGYYDQEMLGGQPGSHDRRLEQALRTMAQLHEEVVGEGFYRPDLEADYAAKCPPGAEVKTSVAPAPRPPRV